MDKLIVTLSGISLIAAIYWFFFGKKEESMTAADTWTVIVEGGYKPSTINIPKDKPATLTFIRKDNNSCLEEVIFPDYKIKKFLPLNKEVTVILPPPNKTSGFHCSMNMFHGRIEIA